MRPDTEQDDEDERPTTGRKGSPATAQQPAIEIVNPLVDLAQPLFELAAYLHQDSDVPDVDSFKRRTEQRIRDFQLRAQRRRRYSKETAATAAYAITATIDDAARNSQWGQEAQYINQTLAAKIYNKPKSSELFFGYLKKARNGRSDDEERNDLLEFFYICLAIGYVGDYRRPDGSADPKLADLRQDLFDEINETRDEALDGVLSERWKGVDAQRRPLEDWIPWWLAPIAMAFILFVSWGVFTIWASTDLPRVQALYKDRESTVFIKRDAPPPPRPEPQPLVQIKKLLEREEADGLVKVEVAADKSIVRFRDEMVMFASGSATIAQSPQAASVQAILAKVAGGLMREQDRIRNIVVLGFTDSVRPTVFARHKTNLALSEARALEVHDRLRALGVDISMTSAGWAEERPRCVETDSMKRSVKEACQAENRRVELWVYQQTQ